MLRRIGGFLPLNIKDPEVYQLARQGAGLTGETLVYTLAKATQEPLLCKGADFLLTYIPPVA